MGDLTIRRPLHLRIGWCVLGIGAPVAVTIFSGPDLLLIAFAGIFGAALVLMALRPKVVIADDAVEIVNVIDHHRIPREDVREFAATKLNTVRCFTHAGPSYPVAALQWWVYDWLFPNVSDLQRQLKALNEALRA